MNKILRRIAQTVVLAAGLMSEYGQLVPPKYRGPINTGLLMAMGAIASVAHKRNEDGTPQEVPYIDPKKLEGLK